MSLKWKRNSSPCWSSTQPRREWIGWHRSCPTYSPLMSIDSSSPASGKSQTLQLPLQWTAGWKMALNSAESMKNWPLTIKSNFWAVWDACYVTKTSLVLISLFFVMFPVILHLSAKMLSSNTKKCVTLPTQTVIRGHIRTGQYCGLCYCEA